MRQRQGDSCQVLGKEDQEGSKRFLRQTNETSDLSLVLYATTNDAQTTIPVVCQMNQIQEGCSRILVCILGLLLESLNAIYKYLANLRNVNPQAKPTAASSEPELILWFCPLEPQQNGPEATATWSCKAWPKTPKWARGAPYNPNKHL